MKEYKIFEKQTWFDVSNYLYGDASHAVELALVNNQNITDDLKAGQIINYPENLEKNRYVVLSMSTNNSIPATALSDEINVFVPTELGIGKMRVGSTFKVK